MWTYSGSGMVKLFRRGSGRLGEDGEEIPTRVKRSRDSREPILQSVHGISFIPNQNCGCSVLWCSLATVSEKDEHQSENGRNH